MVPRLRTTGSAITRSASREDREDARHSADSSSSRWRVRAPIADLVALAADEAELASRSLMSIRYSGVARRSFIIGSSQWPPASSRAPRSVAWQAVRALVDARGAHVVKWCRVLAILLYGAARGFCLDDRRFRGPPRRSGVRRSPIVAVNDTLRDRLGVGMPSRSVVIVDPLRGGSLGPDDPRPAAVVRPRRPPRVRQGRRGQSEVTEPAVCGGGPPQGARRRAVRPTGRGIALTPGGRRLAALGGEILGLAEQARRTVPESPGQHRRLQVADDHVVAEHIGPLIDGTEPATRPEIAVEQRRANPFADLLEHRRADIALGPRPGGRSAPRPSRRPVPTLRPCRGRAPATRSPASGPSPRPSWPGERLLLVGPQDVDPTTAAGRSAPERDQPQ